MGEVDTWWLPLDSRDTTAGWLVDLLRAGAAAGFDTFLVDVTDGAPAAAVARRRRR